RVGYAQLYSAALSGHEPSPIIASAAHASFDAQPSFAATFAEVEVDVETGLVTVLRLLSAVDCGRVVNPRLAEVQVEGGALQGLGAALYEGLSYDASGRAAARSFGQARIAATVDAPELAVILVPTDHAS